LLLLYRNVLYYSKLSQQRTTGSSPASNGEFPSRDIELLPTTARSRSEKHLRTASKFNHEDIIMYLAHWKGHVDSCFPWRRFAYTSWINHSYAYNVFLSQQNSTNRLIIYRNDQANRVIAASTYSFCLVRGSHLTCARPFFHAVLFTSIGMSPNIPSHGQDHRTEAFVG